VYLILFDFQPCQPLARLFFKDDRMQTRFNFGGGSSETGASIKTKLEDLASPNKLSADAIQNGTTNKAYTATEQIKLSLVATEATNDTGATIKAKLEANTTPNKLSADAIQDGTTNHVFTATDDTKLADLPPPTSQSGAPSSTPVRIGAINVDTAAPALRVGKGTSSSADWFLAGSGWLSASLQTTNATETEILSLAATANAENQLNFRIGCVNTDLSKRYSAVFDAFFTSTELTDIVQGIAVKKVLADTMDVNCYVESGNFKVKVTGMADTTLDWKIFYAPVFTFPKA